MQDAGHHHNGARVEDNGTESNTSGRPSSRVSSFTQDGHGTAYPTRVPPKYDDVPRPAPTRSTTGNIEASSSADQDPDSVIRQPADIPPVYFCTEDYPFSREQFDKRREQQLGHVEPHELPGGGRDVPELHPFDFKPLKLQGFPVARSLGEWDKLCLEKHLGATAKSIATPEELEAFLLGKDEEPLHFLQLAGVRNAPGLNYDVAQCCRMTFTSDGRLIFAQILQVFVQQTLTTNYHETPLNCHDLCSNLGICCILRCCIPKCCIPKCYMVGGSTGTDKDVESATQTLGDCDPEGEPSTYKKTRYMQHSLVISYVDYATKSVRQTTAYAHPDIKVSEIYQIARSIEANITLRSTDWFNINEKIKPLYPVAFRGVETDEPLLESSSYKKSLKGTFILALIVLVTDPQAALVMMFAVLFAYGSSRYDLYAFNASKRDTPVPRFSPLMTQLPAGLAYIVSFLVAIGSG